jgi:hypothetical protein
VCGTNAYGVFAFDALSCPKNISNSGTSIAFGKVLTNFSASYSLCCAVYICKHEIHTFAKRRPISLSIALNLAFNI